LGQIDFVQALCQWEGVIPWMYLDQKGLVTVGVGNYLPNVAVALALPFRIDERPASPTEIAADYARVSRMKADLGAHSYKSFTSVVLRDDDSQALLLRRLGMEFLPGLERLFPGFETFPNPVQAALVDMAYTLGLDGLARGFPSLCKYVRARKWVGAAAECHRAHPCREARNAWTRARFLEGVAYPLTGLLS
jgi:GH24 family phage-related lysozyme (muramidase)